MGTRSRPIGISLFGIAQIAVSVLYIVLSTIFFQAPLLSGYALLLIFTNILTLVLGIEFLTHEKRVWLFIFLSAVLDLIAIPIGTALGVLILWYLSKGRVKAYFSRR